MYRRLTSAIRAIDPDHVLFLDGNRYSTEFHMFGDPLPNVVYTNHDYALAGFGRGPLPGVSRGELVDRDALERKFVQRSDYMLSTTCQSGSASSPGLYQRAGGRRHAVPGAARPARYLSQVQRQLGHLDVQGHRLAGRDVCRTGFALDGARATNRRQEEPGWGRTPGGQPTPAVRHIIGPLEELFGREFPNYRPFPFGAGRQIAQMMRHMLLSEPLLDEFADRFRGVTENDIDTLMQSFLFKNCCQRTELAQLLAAYA